jgi:hypothetical protein
VNLEVKCLAEFKVEREICHMDDATEIYHTKYGSDGTRIKFNINSNEDPDAILVGRQSVKSLECIRKSIKKNLYLMKENVRTEFEGYLILCGEANNSN